MTDTYLQPIHDAIDRLNCTVLGAVATADTPERIIEILSLVEAVARNVRETWKRAAEQRALEYIAEHGEFVVGPTRYYAGVDKTTKVKDKAAALDRILEMAGGNVEQAAQYLSSEPYKHGAIRTALAAAGLDGVFEDLFETVEKDELREGKPSKKLKSLPVPVPAEGTAEKTAAD